MSYAQKLCAAVIDIPPAAKQQLRNGAAEREGVPHASQGSGVLLPGPNGCQDAIATSRFLFQRAQPGNLNAGKLLYPAACMGNQSAADRDTSHPHRSGDDGE
jgi:hypothetical protein